MDQQQYRSNCINTAIHLCKHGIRVMPAQFRSKAPLGGVGEEAWNHIATNNINQLAGLMPAGAFNIGMVFGPSSGVLDIEPDSVEASAIIERLMVENGVQTLAYQSRRGVHRIFKWTDKLSHLGNNPKTTHGLECRVGSADRSFYSICPPSIHPDTGEAYEWLPGSAPWQISPAEIPQNVLDYILANVRVSKAGERTHEVYKEGDGYLPGEGGRHDYLLSFSKSLYCDWMLPKEDCMDLTRHMSMRIGSYQEPGRGEVELINLFKDLTRPSDPVKEMQASISIGTVNEVSDFIHEKYRENFEGPDQELPAGVMHPLIEAASRHARDAQMPRNLWIMSIICAAASALGTSTFVRVSPDHPVMANQLYCFGVGGSGTGKSKTLNAINAPFASSETLLTESTPEALTTALSKYTRGIILEFHEGKDFYKMLGRYNQQPGAGSDNSLYHKCWSGDRIRMQRQKGSCWIERPHLVVSAAIQRLNLNQLPQNDLVDGLGQRMIVYPIGSVPKKATRKALAEHAEFMHFWHEVLARLMEVKVTVGSVPLTAMMNGTGTVTKPLINTLTEDAREVWEEYAALKRSDQVESQWSDPEHPFRSDIVRHAEMALRLANVIFMLDHAVNKQTWYDWNVASQDFGSIPADVMKRAIILMEWLWKHKQVYFEGLVEAAFAAVTGGHLQKAETIPAKVAKYVGERRLRVERHVKEESFTLRDYYRLLSIKKVEAQLELDLFLREGHLVDLGVPEGGKAVRYKFLEVNQ
jgi:hypothetical protein